MTKRVDPLIAAIAARLPRPGAAWSAAERARWVELMAGAFHLVYREAPEDAGEVRHGEILPPSPPLAPPERLPAPSRVSDPFGSAFH